jgi:(S)-2-hydroxy-acid oxidase
MLTLVLTAEDALLAAESGVHGIIVSNHGGRQLDGAISTFDALEDIVTAVKGRIQIHFDGGIRRGSDIFKAIALGADYCWVGRIPVWGLAVSDG